jgi:hypothetical protein
MARDKLITIRIEGDKRQAFGDLAKSQNTDTASLLYDFISGCLDGRIDIKLVTGKGNRIDNQIDTDRIDKLEMTTQKIDERVGQISKKLNDWVVAFDDRLNDCDQGLSEKITSLEHRLNALASQLDSKEDRQGETPDMEPLIKEALRLDFMDDQKLIDYIESKIEDTEIDKPDHESVTSPLPTVATVETMEPDSIVEPDKVAIGPVPGDTVSIESVTGEGTVSNRQGLTNAQLSEKTRVPVSTIEKWKGKMKIGEPIVSKRYPDFFKQWRLNPTDSLWYEVD